MMKLFLARWQTLAGAAALAAAFGAGWQVNGWRLDALRAAERVAEAEARAEALEMRDKATRAAEARLTALRGDYTRLQEELDAVVDTGDCGLDRERVRILDGLR